jgi:hypothetical protein
VADLNTDGRLARLIFLSRAMASLGEVVPAVEDWLGEDDLAALADELQAGLERITTAFEAVIGSNPADLARSDRQLRFNVEYQVELLRRNLMLIGHIVPSGVRRG